jgi:peroxiredoxin
VLAGHSQHGDTFDEGPRQKAYLIGKTGNVKFPVTTQVPLVQEFINQGVGQLHGFWYFEAERSFRQAAALDPACAIAYWGMARANVENEKRAKGFIAEAVKRKAGVTPREALYIDAYDAFLKMDASRPKERYQAYVRSLENIIQQHPDDIEAKAFLGLQLWYNHTRDNPISSYFAVDAILKQVHAVEPAHPCHHYRIHLWDGQKAENALDSAALCGQAAPSIAHMWHMPGHIFSKLKRYGDAAWQQEASARVDHAQMIRDGILPDQIHNFAHNNEWLIRDLSHIGRVHDALDLAKNMVSLPRHPKYNTLARGGSGKYGRERLFEVLARYELWSDLIALSETPYLEPTGIEEEQNKRLRYLGVAYLQTGNLAQGITQLTTLKQRLSSELDKQKEAGAQAEQKARADKKDAAAVEKAKADAQQGFAERVRNLEAGVDELLGHLAAANGDPKGAAVLLGKARGVDPLQVARMQLRAGDRDEAEKSARKVVGSHENEVLPLAQLADILWQSEKKKEATETFEQLRAQSSVLDLDMPAFARLAPLARELNLGADWRVAAAPRTDTGVRPPLDSLGPFRWSPSPAPDWALKDAADKVYSLQDYRGKPVVVLFYLGAGCLHCAQQLQAFAPKTEEFAKAGISLIAISTDDQAGLQKSAENYKPGPFPFPLVSNAGLDVFKQYRVYDDFENVPLHAVCFIDGSGLLRWHDIGFEPFMDADFVLKEAQRQLAQSPGPAVAGGQPQNAAAAIASPPAGAGQ